MNEPAPLVSVIVPNYNYSRYLNSRIDSILAQTFSDYELILLDDASTDDSVQVLEQYRGNEHVTHLIVNEKNSGSPFVQWKRGIELARGKYIWIAESDDLAAPEFLENTVNAMEANPQACLCHVGSWIIDSEGNVAKKNGYYQWSEDGKTYVFDGPWYLRHKMVDGNKVYNASMTLFRKDCAPDATSECYSMRYCGDWLFWIEAMKRGGQVIEIHKYLSSFRRHNACVTKEGTKELVAYREFIFIKKWLHREVFANDKASVMADVCRCWRDSRHYPKSGPITRKDVRQVLKNAFHVNWWKVNAWRIYYALFGKILLF